MQEVDDLYEAVFQHSAELGAGLAGVESTAQSSMVLFASIEKIDSSFYDVQGEYESRTLSLAETRDGVSMLLGEVKQLGNLITQMGGDGRVEAVVAVEEAMQAYLAKLDQEGAQSAVIARATEKKVEMKQLLDSWYAYAEGMPAVQGSAELSLVYKSIENFIADLEGLELEPNTTATELEDVLVVRRIVTDVGKFYTEFNTVYRATVLGLFAYYTNDQKYREIGPNGRQVLALKPTQPASGQLDRQYVVYSGSQPLGPKTRVLTKLGTKKQGSNTTSCGLSFNGSRRGFGMCTLLPGVDFAPPDRPPNSDGAATWLQYRTALGVWAQKYGSKLPMSQQQELLSLRADANARVQAGGSQPAPGPPGSVPGGDPGEVADEEWPTWRDGATFPKHPPGDATAQAWQTFKQRTFAYMTDKDSKLSSVQFDQLNARIDQANVAIERLIPSTPTVPETGPPDLGPLTGVCPEWDGISFPVAIAPLYMTASRNQIVCYINNLRTYRGQAGMTQIEIDIVDDLLREALIARSRAPRTAMLLG